MKIGILQTGHLPDELRGAFDDYDAMFRTLLDGHGFTFQTWDVENGDVPGDAGDADGWLITGSRHGAYEDHPWIAPLEALIRDVHARGAPMVGICFGHQIIAQALGGKVAKFAGGWALGQTVYDMGDDAPLRLNAWHQDQVSELPDGARVLGGNDFCRYGVLAYGDTIRTWQPHPEYGDDFIEGLLQTRGKAVLTPEEIAAARATLGQAKTDSPSVAAQMAALFTSAKRGIHAQ